jgi:sulfur-carrier protein
VPYLQVKIRFFTSLREIVGKKEETLTCEDKEHVTVKAVLEALTRKHGKPFQQYVYAKEDQPKSFLQFLINGTSTTTLNGLETELHDGDVLAILPPVGGG